MLLSSFSVFFLHTWTDLGPDILLIWDKISVTTIVYLVTCNKMTSTADFRRLIFVFLCATRLYYYPKRSHCFTGGFKMNMGTLCYIQHPGVVNGNKHTRCISCSLEEMQHVLLYFCLKDLWLNLQLFLKITETFIEMKPYICDLFQTTC